MKIYNLKTTTTHLFFPVLLLASVFSACTSQGGSKGEQNTTLAGKALENAHKLRNEHPDSAIYYSNNALRYLEAEKQSDSLLYKAWYIKSDAFAFIGPQDSALYTLGIWLNHAVQQKDTLQAVMANLELGDNYLQYDRHKLAERYLLNALNLLNFTNFPVKKAEVLESLGNVNVKTGNYLKAQQFFLDAEKIYAAEGRKHHSASFQNNFANMWKDIGDYEKALYYYRLAANTFRELEDYGNLSAALQNIGIIYRKSAPDSALYYYKTADSLHKKTFNAPCIACTYNSANIYLDKKDFTQARKLFGEVEALCQSGNMLGSLARVYNAYAEIELALGNPTKADEYLEKGIALTREAGELPLTLILMRTRFDAFRKTASDKKWITLADDIQTLNDSLHSLEIKQSIHELETQYQVAQKELAHQRVLSAFERETAINRFLFWGITIVSIVSILLTISLWNVQKLKREKSYAYDVLMEKYRQERQLKMEFAVSKAPFEKIYLPEKESFSRIHQFFVDEKPFKDQNLKLDDVCERLQTNPRAFSAVLKKEGFRNFAHFVNQYRVEEARNLMDADENDIYTIEAIAEMAGFGTRQSFYNTFEKVTGVKPAYYRTSLRQKQNGKEEAA